MNYTAEQLQNMGATLQSYAVRVSNAASQLRQGADVDAVAAQLEAVEQDILRVAMQLQGAGPDV